MIRFLQTPTPMKRFVLGFILVAFCLIMVISLVPNLNQSLLGNPTSPSVLAKVGDQDVSLDEVQQRASSVAQQQGYPAQLVPLLMPQALNAVIADKAVLSEAHRMGLKVTNDEVVDILKHGALGEQLFPNGQFVGDDKYDQFVADNFRMSKQQFEDMVRSVLLSGKLRSMIEQGATVTDSEVQQAFKEQNVKVKLEYAVLTLDDVQSQAKVTEPEVKAYFESHKSVYQAGNSEKRKITYAVLPADKINGAQVTDADIQKYYNEHHDDFHLPEQVKVSHILFKTIGPDGKPDPKLEAPAKAKAEAVLKQLKAGGNFADLAKKNSEDNAGPNGGSAAKGGSLDWIQRGQTVPEFEKAAFELPKGQISDLVKSAYGYHIIRVDDKQQARQKPIEEVKAQIQAALEADKKRRALEDAANALQNQARTSGIEKAATAKGAQVFHSDFFGPTDSLPGVNFSPEFMQAVFNTAPKSPVVGVPVQNGVAVFEVTEVQPPAPPQFEKFRAKAESDLKAEKARNILGSRLQELSDRARASHDLKKVAKELGATVKTSELVDAKGQVPDIGSMQQASEAFGMKVGDISAPLPLQNKGVVYSVTERQEPSAEEYAKKKDITRDMMLQRKRQEMFALFTSNLVDQMEKNGRIKKNQAQIDAMSKRATAGGI
jgi:peptidyl-prolyl cis-trans isomerase D